jgi:hypothetical protein
MRTLRSGIAGLACSLALTGCATAREQTSTVTVASESIRCCTEEFVKGVTRHLLHL